MERERELITDDDNDDRNVKRSLEGRGTKNDALNAVKHSVSRIIFGLSGLKVSVSSNALTYFLPYLSFLSDLTSD